MTGIRTFKEAVPSLPGSSTLHFNRDPWNWRSCQSIFKCPTLQWRWPEPGNLLDWTICFFKVAKIRRTLLCCDSGGRNSKTLVV